MPSSWFPLSLPNPFNSDDDDDHQSPTGTGTGTVLTETLGRQLQNVASFLAPPPASSSASGETSLSSSSTSSSSSQGLRGIRDDLAEIGGSFKTGLSLLSSNKAVSGISKFASSFLRFDDDDEDHFQEGADAVGITDGVLGFVREISLRPECWIDFPLSLQHKEFNMTDIQKDHSTTIQQLVPSLAALRHKINSYLSEEQFWMIYYILLLPRLNEDDYKLLSTPEIIEVREVLLQKLKNKMNTPVEVSEDTWESPGAAEAKSSSAEGSEVTNAERTKNSFQRTKSPVENANATSQGIETTPLENSKSSKTEEHDEDDISFSDLENEGNDLSGRRIRQAKSSNVLSANETGDWVRVKETSGTQSGQQKAGHTSHRERHSEGEESSDWLTVDGVDSDASSLEH